MKTGVGGLSRDEGCGRILRLFFDPFSLLNLIQFTERAVYEGRSGCV